MLSSDLWIGVALGVTITIALSLALLGGKFALIVGAAIISYAPGLCARLILIALLPFLPVVLYAFIHAFGSGFGNQAAAEPSVLHHVRVLDEASLRLTRDENKLEQRLWRIRPEHV